MVRPLIAALQPQIKSDPCGSVTIFQPTCLVFPTLCTSVSNQLLNLV